MMDIIQTTEAQAEHCFESKYCEKRNEMDIKIQGHFMEMSKLIEKDYHRLKYHIMPPAGLLNDPNGFIHINDKYHLFYQLHPFDAKHGLKYWGHVTSKDLAHWEQQPIALFPTEWYEKNGCYSGSAVNDEGTLVLIYTGNVKNDEGVRETYQCIAASKDGINFIKHAANPVMSNQPEGYTRHFRDPKVWKRDGVWYMVIGAQTIQETGSVLLYASADLKEWRKVGVVAGAYENGLGELGYMWECPDLFNLAGREVLIVCPQGIKASGDLYNNIYQSGYFTGKLNYETGALTHGKFTELDRGFEFYAPQTTEDEKGRRILIGWMGLPEEDDHPTAEFGWIHTMTIPRQLELINEKIYQKPVEELKILRKNPVCHQSILLEDGEGTLPGIQGDVIELLLEFKLLSAEALEIHLRASEDGKEKTILSFHKASNTIELNRNESGKGYGGIRRCVITPSEAIRLHIFMDTSSLEIFVNDGEEVFSSRIYPKKESKGIKFLAVKGDVMLTEVKQWELSSGE